MDDQKRTVGAVLTAVMLFFCGFICLCLGLGMLFSYPDGIWIWGLVLLGCCGVIIYSGISNLKLSKNIEKDTLIQLQNISTEATKPVTQTATYKDHSPIVLPNQTTPANTIQVLAKWQYSADEWQRFLQFERKERKTSSTIEALTIMILGGIMLLILRSASWLLAFSISTVLAVVYWLGKYFLSLGSIGKAVNNEVIITNRSVVINNRVNTFIDGQYWLNSVSLKRDSTPAVIVFNYGWSTRKGASHEDIRIPVPEGKLQEAEAVVKRMNEGKIEVN
jgi:hypothetical protein